MSFCLPFVLVFAECLLSSVMLIWVVWYKSNALTLVSWFFTSRVVQLGPYSEVRKINVWRPGSLSAPLISAVAVRRYFGTRDKFLSRRPSESLRANSQWTALVQPVRPLIRSFSPVRVQNRKTRCHIFISFQWMQRSLTVLRLIYWRGRWRINSIK